MRAKTLNAQAVIEGLTFLAFGALTLYLVISDKYLSYVTPRMKPYLYFTAFIMLLWAVISFKKTLKPQHVSRMGHCFVLVIPLLLFLLPHTSTSINASDLSKNYISGGNIVLLNNNNSSFSATNSTVNSSVVPQQQSEDTLNDTVAGISSDQSSLAGQDGISSADDAADASSENTDIQSAASLTGLDTAQKTITITDKEFYPWLNEIFGHTEKYVGYEVTIKGYIYREPENMAKDEFVVARLMMTCCVADLVPCGIICKYNDAAALKVDSWFTVKGTIVVGKYQAAEQPQIVVKELIPAEKVDGFIYPSLS